MRLKPKKRKAKILSAAVEWSRTKGFQTMTRGNVADTAGVSPGLINRYFADIHTLRQAVMQEAIRLEIPEIVAVGLAIKNKLAIGAPLELKKTAAKLIIE